MSEKEKEPVQSTEKPEETAKEGVPGEYPEGKEKEGERPLPFCRTAPDPEHLRGEEEDEPCDDYRSGDVPGEDEE